MHFQILLRAVLVNMITLYTSVDAHTWVEQLSVIASNGTMVGTPGYPRGNVLRSSPGFGDGLMVNLIPPNGGPANVIDSNQLMCKQSQATQSQTNGSPRLSAAPGAMVALRYQENGHVSLPQNQPGKPANRGTNFVYYTTQSQSTDKFLAIHRQWTVDGSGGDSRGKLISTQNFDDGQCYQVNNGQISTQRQGTFKHTANNLMGADLWCQQDIQIPADAKAGSTITLYWVWDWPTMPGTSGQEAGKQEIYTSCMDIDIVAGSGVSNKATAQKFIQQDFVSAAASAQFANIANPTAVASPQTIPFSAAAGSGTGAVTPAKSVTSSAGTPVATLKTTGLTTLATTQSARPTINTSATVSPINSLPTIPAASVPANEPTTFATSVSSSSALGQGRGSGKPNHSGQAGATVTVHRTNVFTATSIDSIATPQATTQVASIVTQTETDMVTRTRYNTISARGESESASTTTSDIDFILSMAKKLTTGIVQTKAPEATPSSSSTIVACSKTEAAFRLRARMPFYIVPHQDGSSTGC